MEKCLFKDLKDNLQEVRKCTSDDVNMHFNIVKHLVPTNEHKTYKTRMQLCVSGGMAFCIGNDCFIYMRKTRPCTADAFSLYGKGQPIKTLCMFAAILLKVDKRLLKLSFYRYEGNILHELKSLLTIHNLQRQINPKHPIIVRCDALRNKLFDLYKNRGIQWEE